MKVDIVTSDDIKFHYTGKFQDFTARYIMNLVLLLERSSDLSNSGEFKRHAASEIAI